MTAGRGGGSRFIRAVCTSAAVGGAFGAATSLTNNVPSLLGELGQAHSEDSPVTWIAIFLSQILDAGWAWAAVAFALGWTAGSDARLVRAASMAAPSAVSGLLAATLAYFATDLLFGTDWQGPTVDRWLTGSVVTGVPLGVAGAIARRPGVLGLLACLTVPAGAVASLLIAPHGQGLPGESSARECAAYAVWAGAALVAVLAVARFARQRTRRRT